MKKIEVKDIIKKRRLELGLSFGELGRLCGVDKTTVRKWELGLIENMKRDKMVLLAKALDISPLVLLGIEHYIPEVKVNDKISVYNELFTNRFDNAITEIDNPYPHEKGHLFALEVKINDEMISSLITGDKMYAIFKQQSVVENGTIVAVAIANDKAAIKKFYKFDDVIVLRSTTTESGDPITIVGDQVKDVCILGKFVGIVSPFVD
ncbi:MAG: helix-turn-helix domain-containing protein [Turicibacter sp.]|nr:helix-turn-helix domain-containing protein [Turicibacter sp.]